MDSGISRGTALEIFSNPRDLEIRIDQEEKSDKYFIVISRGPGHNFKLLLDSEPFTDNFEVILEVVENSLKLIEQTTTKELEEAKDPLYQVVNQVFNPQKKTIDRTKTLNSDLIKKIMSELRENKIANTWEMTN